MLFCWNRVNNLRGLSIAIWSGATCLQGLL